jgi:hypothetical protein
MRILFFFEKNLVFFGCLAKVRVENCSVEWGCNVISTEILGFWPNKGAGSYRGMASSSLRQSRVGSLLKRTPRPATERTVELTMAKCAVVFCGR